MFDRIRIGQVSSTLTTTTQNERGDDKWTSSLEKFWTLLDLFSDPVYTIQPVVQPFVNPTGLINRLSIRFDNRLSIQPVVQPDWQPVGQQVVSCKRGTVGNWETNNEGNRRLSLRHRLLFPKEIAMYLSIVLTGLHRRRWLGSPREPH